MFEAVAAVVEATGVEQFAIAGNSMGGWVAWRYVLERRMPKSERSILAPELCDGRSADSWVNSLRRDL
jgi:dienelactone hydrolase